MLRISAFAFLVVGVSFTLALTQETKDKKEAKKEEGKKLESPLPRSEAGGPFVAKAPEPTVGDVQVHFLNGSIVRMTIQSEKLDVSTPYGVLAVPIRDVRSIEFGLHIPEAEAAKIAAALQSLSHGDFRERDRASKTLVELGPLAYPAALEASRSKELEVSRRGRDIVKQLQAKHTKKDLKSETDDKVTTPTFTIVGHILTPTVKAKTELFGQVELAVAKMQSLRAMGGGPNRARELEVAIDAAKYAIAGQWMETSFESDGDTKVLITTKGMVDSWPQQPGQWMVGPDGPNVGGGGRMIINGNIVVGGAAGGMKGQVIPQIHGGALFGKIGPSGEPFLIGSRYEGTLDKEGKLYLHIAPSMWQCNSTGVYDVKITRSN